MSSPRQSSSNTRTDAAKTAQTTGGPARSRESADSRTKDDAAAFSRARLGDASAVTALAARGVGNAALCSLRHSASLPASLRIPIERTFSVDLATVRIHADDQAAARAAAMGARAYTEGNDIHFGAGEYAPGTARGDRLIAHELAHVVQHARSHGGALAETSGRFDSAEHEADVAADIALENLRSGGSRQVRLQRAPTARFMRKVGEHDRTPQGGAVPGSGPGIDLIFIVRDQVGYAAEVAAYVKHTLVGQSYKEVDNLDGIFHELERIHHAKEHVRRIRIVTHGWDTGAVSVGSRRAHKRQMSPREIAQYARRPGNSALVREVMSPGAVVEFWGCSIGKSKEAGRAWSDLFQSDFTATTGYFHTFELRYQGIKHTRDVDQWPRTTNPDWIAFYEKERAEFDTFLLQSYELLLRNRDIAPLKVDSRANRLAFMRELFNRSHGVIRGVGVQVKDSDTDLVGPGNRKEWSQLWVTFSPVRGEDLMDGSAEDAPHPAPAPARPSRPSAERVEPAPARPSVSPAAPHRIAAPLPHEHVEPRPHPRSEHYRRERNVPAAAGETLTQDWYRIWGFDIASANIDKPGIKDALDRIASSLRGGDGSRYRVTVYGEESVSRRAGPRDVYARERADGAAAYLRGQHFTNVHVTSLAHLASPVAAPVDLGRADPLSSPEEKSHLRAVVIHVERIAMRTKEDAKGERKDAGPGPHAPPSSDVPESLAAGRARFSRNAKIPDQPAPLGPYLRYQLEFDVRGEIYWTHHGAAPHATVTRDFLQNKFEAEYKAKLGKTQFKLKAGEKDEKILKALKERRWGDLLKIFKVETDLVGWETPWEKDSIVLGGELSQTPFYVYFSSKRETPSLDIAGYDVKGSVEVRAIAKIGPTLKVLADLLKAGSGVLTTELGTATTFGVALPVTVFVVGASTWTGAGLLSIDAALKKGRAEAAGRWFSQAYAEMIATIATSGIEGRTQLLSTNWEHRVAEAAKAYIDHGDLTARDELLHGGRAAALQHVVQLGPSRWPALRARIASIGNYDAIVRAYRDRIFNAVGPSGGLDLLKAAGGGFEARDMWHLSEQELSGLK